MISIYHGNDPQEHLKPRILNWKQKETQEADKNWKSTCSKNSTIYIATARHIFNYTIKMS